MAQIFRHELAHALNMFDTNLPQWPDPDAPGGTPSAFSCG
jgi:hypothetical protein